MERRRRDNINEKISELATLIPECMLDPSGEFLEFPSVVFFVSVSISSSSRRRSEDIYTAGTFLCL